MISPFNLTKFCSALLLLMVLTGCTASHANKTSEVNSEPLCSPQWYQAVDEKISTGDGQGHGPDLGSLEWQSVIEFKLGIRGKPTTPARNSRAWCEYIHEQVFNSASIAAPSFDCKQSSLTDVEQMICSNSTLAELDQQLAKVYQQAKQKATNEHPPRLAAEQRGWIKGRNDCWKAADKQACVSQNYTQRIAELQARYRLVNYQGPVSFYCENDPKNEFIITFFDTQPPTLIAERGDSTSLMLRDTQQPKTLYHGRNEIFAQKGDEAWIQWGYQAASLHCRQSNE
ncbi:lysozyme inhibitor LprI family protein [Simiduia sp. 21SJ11W-1]|uniref:lysozyme inhibitor LprI family protein n=1 Tax=Simiduia sp. 21SJ11W-1 TaxID=2909669 RepID=UPI00209E0F04|nr:lysozyme inhibitor LprI family protein [Simiduia sp. 21SJ11W-1]UTA48451.1 lysozyme inhibitor LprI family protein [Simiduia sp. 21SJ11W-1]